MKSKFFSYHDKRIIIIASLLILFFYIFFISFIGNDFSIQDKVNYITLLMGYVIFSMSILYIVLKKNFYIFEPITIVTVLMFFIFIIRPLVDIKNNDMACFGVDVRKGCVKTTIIVIISYLAFLLSYYNIRIKTNNKKRVYNMPKTNQKIVLISVIIWVFCFIMTMLYFVFSGKGLQAIFLLRFNSDSDSSSFVGFLSNFAHGMYVPLIIVLFYSKNKVLKIALFALTLLTLIALTFRYSIVICLGSIVVYWYVQKKKSPKTIAIIIAMMVFIFLCGVLPYMRRGIRSHSEIDWKAFTIDDLTYGAFDSDLTVYKPVYSIVTKWPSQYSYYYGQEMILQTITLIIPRAIWPSKPYPIAYEVINRALNNSAVRSGQAFPVIGQFYVEFGVVGCVIICTLCGVLCNKMKNMLYSKNCYTEILYCVFWPTLMQIVIRNYIPSVVYVLLFEYIPFFLITKITIEKDKSYTNSKNRLGKNIDKLI